MRRLLLSLLAVGPFLMGPVVAAPITFTSIAYRLSLDTQHQPTDIVDEETVSIGPAVRTSQVRASTAGGPSASVSLDYTSPDGASWAGATLAYGTTTNAFTFNGNVGLWAFIDDSMAAQQELDVRFALDQSARYRIDSLLERFEKGWTDWSVELWSLDEPAMLFVAHRSDGFDWFDDWHGESARNASGLLQAGQYQLKARYYSEGSFDHEAAFNQYFRFSTASVPEAGATVALLFGGLGMVALWRRRLGNREQTPSVGRQS